MRPLGRYGTDVCLRSAYSYTQRATVLHKKVYYLLIYEKIIDNLKNKVIKFFQYLYTVLLYMPDSFFVI